MPERLQKILDRIRDWWAKFTTRQKAGIISAAVAAVVALIILGSVMSQPTYVALYTADSTKEASEVQAILDGDTTIDYKISDNGLVFTVNKQNESAARLLLGSNNYPTEGYTIDDVISGSFTTTEADKDKKNLYYLEQKMAKTIESIDVVSHADVTFNIPESDGTLIASQLPSYGLATLKLKGQMSYDQAAGIAQMMATALGNDDTEKITVMDTEGNTLFAGGDASSSYGIAAANRTAKEQAEANEALKVKEILSNAGAENAAVFDNTKIAVTLDMNFDDTEQTTYDYSVDEGRTEGFLDSETVEEMESTNGIAGTPGTDANDDTTYVIQDGQGSTSSSSKRSSKYLPDETITHTTNASGKVDPANSTVSVIAYNYTTYYQDQLEATGQLEGTTWEQFQIDNGERTEIEVADNIFTAVSRATSIPENNISIIAYDVPFFVPKAEGRSLTDWLQIILAILILGLLGFVVFRTLRQNQEEEETEEVTVEQLLETTPAEELEDIGYNEKSEARLLIEKFVDENPEAVASLLRNWLNEDWG